MSAFTIKAPGGDEWPVKAVNYTLQLTVCMMIWGIFLWEEEWLCICHSLSGIIHKSFLLQLFEQLHFTSSPDDMHMIADYLYGRQTEWQHFLLTSHNFLHQVSINCLWYNIILLPPGNEEREVLGVGSIPVPILPSCQDLKTIAILLHKH